MLTPRSLPPARSAAAGSPPQALEQLNLPRVVNVVEGHAEDPGAGRRPGFALPQLGDGLAQLAMFSLQQGPVLPPRLRALRCRAGKPVAALESKRPSRVSMQSPTHYIFPIGCVEGNFPDVVPAGCRTPRRLLGGYSAQRLLQVGTVPGLLLVCLVDDLQ